MGNCIVQGKVPVSSTLTNWLQGSKWQSMSLRHLWVMGISSGKLTPTMLMIFLLRFYFCAHSQYLSWKLHFLKNLCFIVKWKWLTSVQSIPKHIKIDDILIILRVKVICNVEVHFQFMNHLIFIASIISNTTDCNVIWFECN